jgi:hypothetical protein
MASNNNQIVYFNPCILQQLTSEEQNTYQDVIFHPSTTNSEETGFCVRLDANQNISKVAVPTGL